MKKIISLILNTGLIACTMLLANNSFTQSSIYNLAANGVTIKASSSAKAGDTSCEVNYTVVDEATLRKMVENGDDLSTVVTTLVTDMNSLFLNMKNFNQDISSWDVSNVTDMSNMFQGAYAFNQDLSSWEVSSATDMNSMFSNTDFNQDISSWDVSSATGMNSMFYGATVFNQDISSWDVSNVTDMSYMFDNASSFNQDISSWSVDNVTSCGHFNAGSHLKEANTPNFTNCTE